MSPTGSDSNPGTLSQPLKTLQRAVNTATAGTTVIARAGVYAEQVTFPRSGTAAGYITLQNYGGEQPVIDGSSIGIGGAQTGLVNLSSVSYIKVSGFEIRNFTSNSSNFVPVGISVDGSGSNIELRNNYVHHIRTTVNNVSGNALGIAVYGNKAPASINGLIIDGNEVAFLTTGSSESLTLNGNVENFQVTNNKVHDNNNIGIDIIGFEGTAPDANYDQARDGVVRGNLVYNITSFGNPAYGNNYGADGIYVDGGTRVIIERNIVHHTDIGVELASEHSGRTTSGVTVRSNLIYLNNLVGVSLGGSGSGNGGADGCLVVNNTLYQNDTIRSGTGEIGLQNHVSNSQFYNNVILANSQGVFLTATPRQTGTPNLFNGNWYFSALGAQQGSWSWNGSDYNNFNSFKGSSGNETLGHAADPLLQNPAGSIFTLNPGSPAINSGLSLSSQQAGTLDLNGNARLQGAQLDAGAYEAN